MHKYQIFYILVFILAVEHIYRLQNLNKNYTVFELTQALCEFIPNINAMMLSDRRTRENLHGPSTDAEVSRSFLTPFHSLENWSSPSSVRLFGVFTKQKFGQLFAMSTEKPDPVSTPGKKCPLDWSPLSSLLISDDKTQ